MHAIWYAYTCILQQERNNIDIVRVIGLMLKKHKSFKLIY